MKYKLNVSCLAPGDIILVGYNNAIGREIQRRTNSLYSHAMLFWHGSIIHASDIVITENPSRILFDEDEAVCVLRLKPEKWNGLAIQYLIEHARTFVGTYYDIEALIAMKKGREVVPNANRQMCAKFVAQCYEYVCLDLVDNYELCTPEDIHKSDLLIEIPDPLLKTTQWDIDFAESYDVTKDQHKAIKDFLEALNKQYTDVDIVSLNQLEDFIRKNLSEGDCVLGLLKKTDYFNLWAIEKENCGYNYDADAFKDMWKDKSATMACVVEKDSQRIIEEKQRDIAEYEHKIETFGDIEYYREMIALRKDIIAAAKERIEVAKQVKKELGVVKFNFSWC